MTTQELSSECAAAEQQYWYFRLVWERCLADPEANYRDFKNCADETGRAFERLVGLRWALFRRMNGYVRPISLVRAETEFDIENVLETRKNAQEGR